MKDFREYTPRTLEDAITVVWEAIADDAEAMESIKRHYTFLHHSVGRLIRNAWLWNPEHPLNEHFRTRFGLGHADDMSGMILQGLHMQVNGFVFNPDKVADHYKAFWLKENTDPLSGERFEDGQKPARALGCLILVLFAAVFVAFVLLVRPAQAQQGIVQTGGSNVITNATLSSTKPVTVVENGKTIAILYSNGTYRCFPVDPKYRFDTSVGYQYAIYLALCGRKLP